MAATIGAQTTVPINSVPTVRQTQTSVTFDNSYPTGGLGVTAAQLGLANVGNAVATLKTAGAGAVTQVWYDVANSKLKAFAASAEIANAVDLSAVTAIITAWGQ